MRFYEYESKALFARHGMPLGKSGQIGRASCRERVSIDV